MLNKKRLAMMALAASMVIPSNLAYISVATPITVMATGNEYTKLKTIFGADNVNPGTYSIELKGGNYTLTDDIGADDLDKALLIKENVTINLANHNITSSAIDSAYYTFAIVDGGHLTISGSGTITNNYNPSSEDKDGAAVIAVKGGDLTIGSTDAPNDTVNIVATHSDNTFKYGISLFNTATSSTIEVNNTSFTGDNGIYTHGNLEGEAQNFLLTLNDITVTATDGGIYQAGISDITINGDKTNIKGGKFGIETRAGNLTVNAGKIQGGEGEIVVAANKSGSTSQNAGIAIAQHTTNAAITAKINKAEVSGTVPLIITDPQDTIGHESITIDVKESKLNASGSSAVAYSEDDIKFTLTNTALNNKSIQKVTIDESTHKLNNVGDVDKTTLPYTIILDLTPSASQGDSESTPSISKDVLANFAETDGTGDESKEVIAINLNEEIGLPDTYAKLPLNSFENGLTQESLGKALSDKSKEEVEITVDGTPEKKAPGYTYTVENLTELEAAGPTGITVKGEPTVKVQLDSSSIVKLVAPATQDNEQEPSTDPEAPQEDLENPISPEKTEKNTSSELYVPLSETGTTKNAINNYLKSKKLHVADSVTVEDFSNPLTVGENKDVQLDDNGFIEIKLEDGAAQNTNRNPGGGGTSSKPKPKPEEPTTPVATPTSMYRLYNKLTGEHLYTIDKKERDNLLTSDTWKDEGQGWIAPSESNYPVYRLLNPNNGDHHYTMDKNEFDTLPSYGWVAEGLAFFSADKDNPENVILHRLYNPNAEGAGSHHYTADTNERDTLVGKGWTYEGLAWAGLPAEK